MSVIVSWLSLLTHEDVQQDTTYQNNHGSNLNAIVVFTSKEETENKYNGCNNDQNCTQVLFEFVHCFMLFCLFSNLQIN